MSNRLHRARSGCDGLLFPAVVHRSLSSRQQQRSGEFVFFVNLGGHASDSPQRWTLIFLMLAFWSNNRSSNGSSQKDFKGYKREEICTALLDVCPPDPATLRKCHQDQKTQTQNNMLNSMFPSGTGALHCNVQSCVDVNTRRLDMLHDTTGRKEIYCGMSQQLNMTQDSTGTMHRLRWTWQHSRAIPVSEANWLLLVWKRWQIGLRRVVKLGQYLVGS